MARVTVEGEPQQREIIFAPQYLAIRHAVAVHGHRCQWMAFFDVDEFVAVPSVVGTRAFARYLQRLQRRRPNAGGVRLYSVLMLPFACLILPIVSTMITDAEPTGYDKSGQIGGMLTPAMMERKRKYQKKAAKRAARRLRKTNSSLRESHDDDDDDDDDEPTHSERAAFEAPLKALRSIF